MRKVRGRPISSLLHTVALVFILCLGILVVPLASSEQIAPGGGGEMPLILLSPNPGDEGIVLVSNDMGIVFRSEDSGTNFTQITSFQVDSNENIHHLQLTNGSAEHSLSYAKPWAWTRPLLNTQYDTPRIFAGGRYGFYKSLDKGKNWTKITNGYTESEGPYYVAFSRSHYQFGIAVAEANDSTSTAPKSVIYVTDDMGNNWTKISYSITEGDGHVKGIFFDHADTNPLTFFYATQHNVYRGSYNINNNTYVQAKVETGLPLPVDPNNTEKLSITIRHLRGESRTNGRLTAYLTYDRTSSADAAFYRLTRLESSDPANISLEWNQVRSGLPLDKKVNSEKFYPFYDQLDISESDLDIAYVTYEGGQTGGAPESSDGGDGGIFKTTDGGNSWQEVLFIHKAHQKFNVYDGTDKTDSTKHSWLSESNWIWCQKAKTVFISPTDPDSKTIYTNNGGLFRSTNGGDRWSSLAALNLEAVTYAPFQEKMATPTKVGGVPAGIPVLAVKDYFIAPQDNKRHHFLSNGDFGFFHSTNWGSSWIRESIGINGNIYRVAADQNQTAGRLWAVGGGVHGLPRIKGLQEAYDKSNSTPPLQATGAYTTDYFKTSTLFQPKKPGPDGTPIPLNAVIVDIFIDGIAPNETWYIAALGLDGGVYKSTDQGTTWSLINPNNFWTSRNYLEDNGAIIYCTPENTDVKCKSVNRNVIRVGKIPGTDTLFALTTRGAEFQKEFTDEHGLYFLENNTWSKSSYFKYATDIEFRDQNTAYVSGWSQDKDHRGGVWEGLKNSSGSWSWIKIFDAFGVSNITLTPQKDKLYLSVMDEYAGEELNTGTNSYRCGTQSYNEVQNFGVYIMSVPYSGLMCKDTKFDGFAPMKIQFNEYSTFYTTFGDGVIKAPTPQ
jgi:hypothetical protein